MLFTKFINQTKSQPQFRILKDTSILDSLKIIINQAIDYFAFKNKTINDFHLMFLWGTPHLTNCNCSSIKTIERIPFLNYCRMQQIIKLLGIQQLCS